MFKVFAFVLVFHSNPIRSKNKTTGGTHTPGVSALCVGYIVSFDWFTVIGYSDDTNLKQFTAMTVEDGTT